MATHPQALRVCAVPDMSSTSAILRWKQYSQVGFVGSQIIYNFGLQEKTIPYYISRVKTYVLIFYFFG